MSKQAFDFLSSHLTHNLPPCTVAKKSGNSREEVSTPYLPCYFTPNHFVHALSRFGDAIDTFSAKPEAGPCSILGASLLQAVQERASGEQWLWQLQQLRSLWELCKQPKDNWLTKAKLRVRMFVRSPLHRNPAHIPCLVGLFTEALLFAPEEDQYFVSLFAKAMFPELIRRLASSLPSVATATAASSSAATVEGLIQHARGIPGEVVISESLEELEARLTAIYDNEEKKAETSTVVDMEELVLGKGLYQEFSNLLANDNNSDKKVVDDHNDNDKKDVSKDDNKDDNKADKDTNNKKNRTSKKAARRNKLQKQQIKPTPNTTTSNNNTNTNNKKPVAVVPAAQLQLSLFGYMLELRRRWSSTCAVFGGVEGVFKVLDCAMLSDEARARHQLETSSTDPVQDLHNLTQLLANESRVAPPRLPEAAAVLQGLLLRDNEAYSHAVLASAACTIQRAFRGRAVKLSPGGPSVTLSPVLKPAAASPSSASPCWVSPYRESAWLRLRLSGLVMEALPNPIQTRHLDLCICFIFWRK